MVMLSAIKLKSVPTENNVLPKRITKIKINPVIRIILKGNGSANTAAAMPPINLRNPRPVIAENILAPEDLPKILNKSV